MREHDIFLNPIGKEPDIGICNSIGHDWEYPKFYKLDKEFQEQLNKMEIIFRVCTRCERTERNCKGGWTVNKVEAGIA